MEDNVGMSELMEIIFGRKSTINEKKGANSSIPSRLLTKDFSKRLGDILRIRKRVVFYYWRKFLHDSLPNFLSSSHELYLMSVITACIVEEDTIRNTFDSFISVCALVMYVNEETFAKTGIDFRDFNPDIFIVFYRNVMKKSFLKRKGFFRFMEYIHGHRYLKWIRDRKGLTLSDDSSASVFLELEEKIQEGVSEYRALRSETQSSKEKDAYSMAKKLLSETSAQLPALPSEPDLIRLFASKRKEMTKKAERNRKVEATLTNNTSNGNSSSISKADYSSKQQDIARHENIIQAVIRHNHSKNSGHENAENQIHQEANGILDYLTNTIKNLVEVLDESENK